MPDPRTYSTPAAFKTALDDRLKREATCRGTDVVRLRQVLVFERLLVRIVAEFGESVLVKGGVAMELRLDRARMTRDIDLRAEAPIPDLASRLVLAGQRELADHLTYVIAPDRRHPTLEAPGITSPVHRFKAEARLAGKTFAFPFGIDVGVGDLVTEAPDLIDGSELLAFVGVPRPRFRLYPKETHLAEKLHAFTLPRDRPNTRVKDLPDIALLAQAAPYSSATLRRAIDRTFESRGVQPVPTSMPAAPREWVPIYARLARENRLPWPTLDQVEAAARAFLDPVLAGTAGHWSPARWAWS